MIRDAGMDDLGALLRLARISTTDSDLPFTFNEHRAGATLRALISKADVDFLVAVEDGVLLATAILVYEASYYTEVAAYIDKFFVHKELRGVGVSRELLAHCVLRCKERGARVIFASATAGMGERVEKLYVKLFERQDFTVLGRILMRTLE